MVCGLRLLLFTAFVQIVLYMGELMSTKRAIYILLFFITQPVLAEQLPTISVSASRTPIAIKESGSSINVINQTEIENRQVPFVADLLRDVPGTAISQNGGAGTFTQLRLRGAEANHTQVIIDGIEANDVTLGNEFNFAHLLTCGVERIEVLRGPQSALWGSDALAGVVNVQTIRGSGPLKLESTFSTGRFDTRQNCTGLSAGNDLQNFSLYGAYFENNGSNISELGNEDDSYRNSTVNFRYQLTPKDNFLVDISGRHVDSEVETDPFSPPIDGDRETDSKQNYFKINSVLNLFSGLWSQEANISLSDSKSENFADGIENSSTEGEKMKFSYQSSLHHSINSSDHTITFAYEREREKFAQKGIADPLFGDPNQRRKAYNKSFIGEYRIGVLDQFFLNASVRKDDNDDFDNRSTHRLAATYIPKGYATQFRAAYGTAVKNPSFIERFGFASDSVFFPFEGNPDLKPEKSKGWEAGITHAFSDHLEVSATYFSEELKDEINGFFRQDASEPFTAINLDEKSHRKGIELSFNAKPINNLTLIGSYTYVDSKQPDATGNTTELRVPRNTASLITNYSFLEQRANINLRVNYTDDQFDNNFSTFPATREKLSDYTTVNIAADYQLNNFVALQGRVENLFNKNYQNVFGFETRGINAHLGIKLKNF